MRVLVTTIPGLGHFHPMVPLCRALVAAGYEVVVAVPRSFETIVCKAGLASVAVRPDWVEEDADAYYPGFTSGLEAQMEAFVTIPRDGLVQDIVDLGRTWEPEVIVHDHCEFGGWIASEILQIPNVPFAMTARVMDPSLLGLLAPTGTGDLLAHFGLPADPAFERASRWLYLDSIPPSFAATLFPATPTVHPVRYATDDRTGEESLPAWCNDLGARPVVYVTMGTVFNRTPGVLRKLVDAAATHDVDVIVTTGRTLETAAIGDVPSNVRVEQYIPQADLLSRCDVVVCHGGFNTVFGALSVGCPVVLVPLSADQPFNAYLCESGGFGMSCTTELPEGALFPLARADQLTEAQVSQAIGHVLADPAHRAAAATIRQEILSQPPIEHAVGLIERLARTRQPVTNGPA